MTTETKTDIEQAGLLAVYFSADGRLVIVFDPKLKRHYRWPELTAWKKPIPNDRPTPPQNASHDRETPKPAPAPAPPKQQQSLF